MTHAPLSEVVREARGFVERELADLAVAAFLYGSVVTSTPRSGSDIDCFLVTTRPLRSAERGRVQRRFSALQRRLGYIPDSRFPVELVTVEQCWKALEGPALKMCMEQVDQTGRLDPAFAESDEVEVWRALLGRRITLIASERLEALAARAHRALDEASVAADALRAFLGVDHGPSRRDPVAQP